MAFLLSVTVILYTLSIGSAHAACAKNDFDDDNGTAFSISGLNDTTQGDSGGEFGLEGAQYRSTCDNDGEYRGYVQDRKTDGRYVQVRLSTARSMKNKWIQTYTGNWRKYRSWGRGTYYMRICKSGTPIGVASGDARCSDTFRHTDF